MNKIYKLVWSGARHMYVVASEVAKSHRKEKTGREGRLALAMMVALSTFFGGGWRCLIWWERKRRRQKRW